MLTIDPHVHTIHSGDSPCEVEDAISTAKKNGLDGIAITDHNSISGLEKAKKITKDEDFLFIPGIEVSSKHGHILGLGIEDDIEPKMSAEKTVKKIREKGGIAVSAHPFSLDLRPFSILNADFDAIEIFNSKRYIGNQLVKKYVQGQDIPVSGGSDAHFCDEIGLAGVKVNADPRVDEVLKKIKEGKASVFGRYLPITGYLRRALFKVLRYR